MIVNIQVRAFSSNKLQLFSYTILEDYRNVDEFWALTNQQILLLKANGQSFRKKIKQFTR